MWGEALEPVLLASFLDYFAMACYMCEPLGQMVQSLEYLRRSLIGNGEPSVVFDLTMTL